MKLTKEEIHAARKIADDYVNTYGASIELMGYCLNTMSLLIAGEEAIGQDSEVRKLFDQMVSTTEKAKQAQEKEPSLVNEDQ